MAVAVVHILAARANGPRPVPLTVNPTKENRYVPRSVASEHVAARPSRVLRGERASCPGQGQRHQQDERADVVLHVASTELE